ncbi:sialic acid-binding Ig-like lectin 16 isoform X1 [Aquarana catesbeiana]|uniref:sialic acid-binding Ig-like lectin 16 isoform X1 n=1 Tax=Aquarana catesbeiana TaxID=8400 RepID=UPI003CC9FFA5
MGFTDLDHFLLLLFIMSSLLNTTFGADHSKYTVIVQRDISVQRGLCVYIPCRFTLESGSTSAQAYGIWYKGDSKGEVVSSQNPSKNPPQNPGRIFFTGDATKLDCSMSINDVQFSDGDKPYLFRLQDDGGEKYNYVNHMIQLTVTELMDKPVIITPVTPLLADKEVTLTCESPGRCNGSAPLITWNRRGVQRTGVTHTTIHPDGNKTYYSNITFTPSKQDHLSSLTCNVSIRASSASTQNQIILNVEYPPIVSIIVKDNIQNENTPIIVNEGDSETIKCTVDSNPNSTIIWTKEDIILSGTLIGQTLIYSVKNANPNDTGIYRCSANNRHSSITRSINITVHYAPRNPQIHCSTPTDCPIDGNKTIYIKEESSLSLRCAAESFPPAALNWSTTNKNQQNFNTNQNGEISFSKILLSDDGSYTCQAKNERGNSSASVTIKVTFGPRSVSGKNSTCKEAEHHIECSCIIESFPVANIQWKIDEKSYNTSDKDIQITTCRIKAETNSTLSLPFNQKDVPSIECISSNQYEKFVLPLLSKKSLPEKSSLGMIAAVSVVLAVSVMLGIAFIILQYFRRRKLKQEGKDEKELTSNSQDAIYSNASVFCNNGEISQEIPNKNSTQDDRTVYMNCEEVQYASINFAAMKTKPSMEVTEPETEYAIIKPR